MFTESCSRDQLMQKAYRAFSITWPASVQIYWNKRKRLHKKRVQLPQDLFKTPSWPPFYCFGTPIWPPWRHVKTLYLNKMHTAKWICQKTSNLFYCGVPGLASNILRNVNLNSRKVKFPWFRTLGLCNNVASYAKQDFLAISFSCPFLSMVE